MNLDDLKETRPFLLTIAKVGHIRGTSILMAVSLQDDKKNPRQQLAYRLGELTNETQARIKDVFSRVSRQSQKHP